MTSLDEEINKICGGYVRKETVDELAHLFYSTCMDIIGQNTEINRGDIIGIPQADIDKWVISNRNLLRDEQRARLMERMK